MRLHFQRGPRQQPREHDGLRRQVRRQQARRHIGPRHPRGENREFRAGRESTSVPRRVQHVERVRRRNDHRVERHGVPAADGDSRSANRPDRRAFPLVGRTVTFVG